MAIQVERMVAVLEARLDKYEKGLAKAAGTTNRQFTAIERRGKQMESRLSNLGAGIGRNFLGTLAAGASLRGAQRLIDAATRIENALKVAGLSGEELTKVYDRLFESAQKNAAPLESLVTLYGRAAIVQKELGVSTEELLGFTNNVAVALRVAGTDAQSASGALLQLSQALGSGTVRAEEFNSILEGALPVAQAAAAGLKEAGGSVAALRQLVVDGKVSSEAFFRAFEAGSVILEDKVAGAELTVSQSFVRLQNVLIDTAGKLDDSTDASATLARFLNGPLTDAIKEIGAVFYGLGDGPIADFIGWINQAVEATIQGAADIGAALGADVVGRQFGAKPFIGPTRIQDRIDQAFAGTAAPKGNRAPTEITASQPNAVVKPVSISDYAAPSGKGKGGSGKSKQSEFAREIEQIKERTAALQAETAAMAGLNPLINDYGFAVEKARAVQDLLNAAQQAGIAITPELRAQIDALATGYANAGVAAEQLAESQDELREAFEDMRDLGKDVMGGFIHDLIEGKSATDALAGALAKVGDKLLEIAMNDLFGKSGSNGMGIIGDIIGGLFGGGGGGDPWGGLRANGGPVSAGKAYVVGEKRPELFVPTQSGTIIPQVPEIPKVSGGGGGTVVQLTFAPTIDNRGASVEAVARNEQQIAKMRAELPAMVVQAVRSANSKNVKFG